MDYVTSVDHRVSDIEQHFKKLIILQRNTELSFQNLHLEMKEFKDEMYLDRKSLNKKWGDLANKMGTIIEDIVSPNIPSIAKKYFNCDEIDHLMIRNYKRSPDKSKGKEFDLIAVCGDKVIFNNTKSSPSAQYIAEFIEELKNNVLFEYFPELSDKEVIPIFSSLSIREDLVTYLTRNKISAMAMTGDTMDLINAEEILSD